MSRTIIPCVLLPPCGCLQRLRRKKWAWCHPLTRVCPDSNSAGRTPLPSLPLALLPGNFFLPAHPHPLQIACPWLSWLQKRKQRPEDIVCALGKEEAEGFFVIGLTGGPIGPGCPGVPSGPAGPVGPGGPGGPGGPWIPACPCSPCGLLKQRVISRQSKPFTPPPQGPKAGQPG